MSNNKNFAYILNCAIIGNEILSKKNMNLDELQREIKELIVSSLDLEMLMQRVLKQMLPYLWKVWDWTLLMLLN